MESNSGLVLAAVALGSNLGDKRGRMSAGIAGLNGLPRSRLLSVSSLYETEPVGGPARQEKYLNAAAIIETGLSARELLRALLEVERVNERERVASQRFGPRTLDLDLLTHGDEVVCGPELILPHPRLHERRFVLEPLAEIAPDLVIPGLRRTVAQLLASLLERSSGTPPRLPPAGGE